MNDVVLTEGIYVKRVVSAFGSGNTSRECVMESNWIPYKTEDGFVELIAVTDNLDRVLAVKERVSVKYFNEVYKIKDNSQEIYHELKKTIP